VSAQDLAERYGAPAPWRRHALVAGSVLVAVLAAAWVVWAGWAYTAPEVSSELETSEILGEHAATAVIVVDLRDDDVVAQCLVRAFAEDHNTVGEAEFRPDPADGPRHTVEVRTERRATAVELVGCRTADQPRYR
jgi:hypothetical protein